MGSKLSKSVMTITKSSLESLVFFVFGATMDEDDYLLKRVVEKAFFDATNQGAFNALIEKTDVRKERVNVPKNEVIANLLKKIKEYTKPKGKEFEEWHSGICKSVKETYDAYEFVDEFSYGNAQKLVNMTLKYLYLLSGIQEPTAFAPSIQEILDAISEDSQYLNIPIDSYIIDAIWENSDEESKMFLPRKREYESKNKSCKSYLKGWSKWDPNDYEKAQKAINAVKKECDPMEWESKQWISIAKKRRQITEEPVEKHD